MAEQKKNVVVPTYQCEKIVNINNIKKKIIASDDIRIMKNCDSENCIQLEEILKTFNSPISEDQAWALIYQSIRMYVNLIEKADEISLKELRVPVNTKNIKIHKDGLVHIDSANEGEFINRYLLYAIFYCNRQIRSILFDEIFIQ